MTWEYATEYDKLLTALDSDKRPWRPASLLPEDGTEVFLKCSVDYKGDTRYDVGQYQKFSDFWKDYCHLEGEWNTEFGNCESITGWKTVEEK